MQYTITITLEDLKAAKAVPWNTDVCVVAQAFARCTGIKPTGGGASGFYVERQGPSGLTEDTYEFDFHVADIVEAFDRAHQAEGDRDYSSVERLLPTTRIATLK